jgi:hypothetical protein
MSLHHSPAFVRRCVLYVWVSLMTIELKAVGTLTDTDSTPDDLVVYLLMRTDLPSMNPGKAMAQAYHAGNQITKWYASKLSTPIVEDYLGCKPLALRLNRDSFMDDSKALWFGTTICLGATAGDINRVMLMSANAFVCGEVIDPSYPFLVDSEIVPYVDREKIDLPWEVDLREPKTLVYRRELTCAWFLGRKSDRRFVGLFEGFGLHP